MLTMDVSMSVISTDIRPSRIEAAKSAAVSFVEGLTPGINLDLVTFGGTATVQVTPTTERKPVIDAINNIRLLPAITTISFGTESGVAQIEGRPVPVLVDNPAMKEIARISGGDFFEADSAERVRSVYDTLGEQIGYETRRGDAGKPWFALAAALTTTAAGTGLALTRRLP